MHLSRALPALVGQQPAAVPGLTSPLARRARSRRCALLSEPFERTAVRGLFDRMSRSYERMSTALSFGLAARWRRHMIDALPARPAPRVLDAMSGMGESWAALERRYPGAAITAVDFSPAMSERAAVRNRAMHAGRIDLLRADVLCSGIPDRSYDVVVCAYGLKTLGRGDQRRYAAELARLLRPGGSYAFVELTQPATAVLRVLLRLHLRIVVPLLGLFLVSDPADYRMLHRYISAFGDGDSFRAALADQPELTVEVRRHAFGCATTFSGGRVTSS